MVEKIIQKSYENRFIVLFFTFILAIASIYAIKNTNLDAIPDLSANQVIIEVEWAGQSAKTIEDQIAYPLISNFLSLPNIETVRAMSSFSNSMIYILFKDEVDIYEARTRVLEKLSTLQSTFPKASKVNLGPDATGVGWAYQYALKSDTKSLAQLRTLQDYFYKFALLGVDGVSEVASIGGFVKNFEITLDQDKLKRYDISILDLKDIIASNNNDSGGRVILENGYEKIINARAYIQNLDEIENLPVKNIGNGVLKLKDIANINITSSDRRGVAELNGEGESVGGIVVVRYGKNVHQVIKDVKKKLETLHIDDVEVIEVYDRTSLIDAAIDTLKRVLIEESLIVMLIVALFLLHFRSALVIIITLPLTVLFSFLLMKLFNIGSNIMSLAGIAIAIGAMVDATIIMVENAHKHLANKKNLSKKEHLETILKSSKQVGRPIFFALVLVIVSFLPIFFLTGQEGKLFSPLAFTKTFAMLSGAILSITLVPILIVYLVKGKIKDEQSSFINRFFIAIYSPILKISLKLRYLMILIFIATLVFAYYIYKQQKWEFMPLLNEQSFMYMPVTPYGIGVDLAKELAQKTNMVIKSFPEVENSFAKAGRANSATDPAPLAMLETIITFKPQSQWREGMTYKKLQEEMDKKLRVEGLINSWTYPIKGRIDMLITGIRTPLGIKLYGNDTKVLQEITTKMEERLRAYDGTLSVSADKINQGYYINIKLLEENLSKYNLHKDDILETISLGLGSEEISLYLNKLERYPITLRYDITQRHSIEKLEEILIKTDFGFKPLKTFAKIEFQEQPSVIQSEKALNVAYVYITPNSNTSIKEYKDSANELLKDIKLPNSYYFEWSGESEFLEQALDKLQYIIPLTLMLIFVLIYLSLKNILYTFIIFLTLPFALSGGIFYIELLGFNISIAVIVGFLALLGVAAETSIIMLVYLDNALKEQKAKNQEFTKEILVKTIYEGAVLRLRPKLMTLFSILGALIPIMYISSVGSEITQRIAAPMIGGMISSAILTLIIIPAVFYIFIERNRIKV